jgi:hypothetical protein
MNEHLFSFGFCEKKTAHAAPVFAVGGGATYLHFLPVLFLHSEVIHKLIYLFLRLLRQAPIELGQSLNRLNVLGDFFILVGRRNYREHIPFDAHFETLQRNAIKIDRACIEACWRSAFLTSQISEKSTTCRWRASHAGGMEPDMEPRLLALGGFV